MLQRALGPFREFGLLVGLLYAVDRLLRMFLPRVGLYIYELVAQPISESDLLPRGLAKNVTFEEIGRGHPDLPNMPAREDIKAARFEQGATCLAAYRKGELVGFVWWCRRAYEEDEVRCTYILDEPEHCVFDFDMYVFPKYRMGIGFMAVWHGANQLLRQRGIRFTCSRVSRFNTMSLRAHARLGARSLGKALFVQLGSLQLMISTLAPYLAVSFASRSRARLRLNPHRS